MFIKVRSYVVYIILQLAHPPPLNILKLGAHRGIQECRNQFEKDSSLWNCTFDWKRVDPELPIFFNNTLPHGKIIFYTCDIFVHSVEKDS